MKQVSSDFSLAQRFITAGAAAWGDDDDDYDALASVSILGGVDSPPRRLTASRSVPDVPRSSTPLEHVAADFPWNANIFSLTASPVAALLAPEPPLASPTPPPRSLPPLDRAWHRQPASRVADATSQAKPEPPPPPRAASGVLLPSPHEVVASVVQRLGPRFGAYSDALLHNSVGYARLRRADASALADANVRE